MLAIITILVVILIIAMAGLCTFFRELEEFSQRARRFNELMDEADELSNEERRKSDMNRIVVCLDCPSYQKGGYCAHKRKNVAALQEACEHAKTMDLTFNPENKEEEDMTAAEIDFEIIEDTPATKTCTKSGETKPITDFYKDNKASDGHRLWCKTCVSRDNAQRARKTLAEKRAAKAQEPQQP